LLTCVELETEKTDKQRKDVSDSYEEASETIELSIEEMGGVQQKTSKSFTAYKLSRMVHMMYSLVYSIGVRYTI